MEELIINAKEIIKTRCCIGCSVKCTTCPLHLYNNVFKRRTVNDVSACSTMFNFGESDEKIQWLSKWIKKYRMEEQLEFDF